MSQHEWASFSAAEIKAIGDVLKLKHRWQWQHLGTMLRLLPQTAASFRTTRVKTPSSQREHFLRQVEANPQRRLSRLLRPNDGESKAGAFDRVLQDHDGLPLLLYHVARLLAPPGRAEEWLMNGRARDALLATNLDNDLIRKAAQNARANLARDIRRGKGGDRRSSSSPGSPSPQDLLVEHILEIYRHLTGKVPGLSNDSTHLKAADREGHPDYPETAETKAHPVTGPAPSLLRMTLPRLGFPGSDSTIRRHIEAFRKAKGVEPKRGSR